MQRQTAAMLAAAFLAGSSTVALAQTGYGGYQGGQGNQAQSSRDPNLGQGQYERYWIPGPVEPTARDQAGTPNPYSRLWAPGPVEPTAQSTTGQERLDRQSRLTERMVLRRQLRQFGFRNVRILDAAFLVQARTPDGRPVVMILSPSDEGRAVTTSSLGGNRPAGGQGPSARGQQQFGTTGNAAPGLEELLDLRELGSPMVNPGLVEPGQMREYLQSRGFSDISNLRRDGSFYTGTAQWRGQRVNLRVDARNGLIVEPDQYMQSRLRR